MALVEAAGSISGGGQSAHRSYRGGRLLPGGEDGLERAESGNPTTQRHVTILTIEVEEPHILEWDVDEPENCARNHVGVKNIRMGDEDKQHDQLPAAPNSGPDDTKPRPKVAKTAHGTTRMYIHNDAEACPCKRWTGETGA